MRLYVRTVGEGPDLVLLHGWGLHGGVFSPMLPALTKRFRVTALDLPGHGFSAFVPFGELDDIVAELVVHIPPQSLVAGWSLGGLLAQRIAVRHPDRVRALALISTTPSFVQRPDWPHAMKEEALAGFAAGLRTDLGPTLKTFVALNALGSPEARPAMRALAEEMLARGAPEISALVNGLALLRATDLRPDAGRIEAHTVVVHGGRDALTPVEAGRWLAAHLPRAELLEIPEAAHLPFVSHPEVVAAALEALRG